MRPLTICGFVTLAIFFKYYANALKGPLKIHNPYIDLVLAFDESGHQESREQYYIKMFNRFFEWFDWYYLGKETKTQVAIIQCVEEVSVKFYLNQVHTTEFRGNFWNAVGLVHRLPQDKTWWPNSLLHKCLHRIRDDVLQERNGDRPLAPNVVIVFSQCNFNRRVFGNSWQYYYNAFEHAASDMRRSVKQTNGWFGFVCYTVPGKFGRWDLVDRTDYELSTFKWAGSNEDNVLILKENDYILLRRHMDKVLPTVDEYYVQDCEFEDPEKDCNYFGFSILKCYWPTPQLSGITRDPYNDVDFVAPDLYPNKLDYLPKRIPCRYRYLAPYCYCPRSVVEEDTTITTTTLMSTTTTTKVPSTTTTKMTSTTTTKIPQTTSTFDSSSTKMSSNVSQLPATSVEGKPVEGHLSSTSVVGMNTSATEKPDGPDGQEGSNTENGEKSYTLYIGIAVGALILLLLLLLIVLAVFWRRRRDDKRAKAKRGKGTGASEQKRKENMKGVRADLNDVPGSGTGTKKKSKFRNTGNEGLTERERKEKMKGVQASLTHASGPKISKQHKHGKSPQPSRTGKSPQSTASTPKRKPVVSKSKHKRKH